MAASSLSIYHPGDLVLSEKPFAYMVFEEYQGYHCDYCLRRGQMKKCSSCNYIQYCNRACQKGAWPDHKLECKYLKNISEDPNGVRWMGKVILKLKGKDWKTVTANIPGNKRSFEDLISHREETIKDPKRRLHLLEASYLQKQYLGQENLPEEIELHEIIGKVRHNGFGFDSGIGCGLYIGASVLDHSCIPNAVRVFNGTAIEIRTICDIACAPTFDDIKKNITISYTPTVPIEFDPEEAFFGPCKCSDCSLPYGESTLTKIIDKTKAFRVIGISESTLKFLFHPLCRTVPIDMHSVAEIFKKQEGVLGNTNILRLKLLFHKVKRGSGFQKMEDLKMFIDFGKSAFGPNSDELSFAYKLAAITALEQGDVASSKEYTREAERLSIIHYGKKQKSNRFPLWIDG